MSDQLKHLPQEGFLSKGMEASVAAIRRQYERHFGLARSFNSLCMDVLVTMRPDGNNNEQLLIASLYGSILTSLQSAVILCERGLTADARTIIRTCIESVIIFQALIIKGSDVTEMLLLRDMWHRRKLLKSWLDDPIAVNEMTSEQKQHFETAIAEIETLRPAIKDLKKDPINVQVLATQCGLLALYNSVFRQTSGDAVHTSIAKLERHIRADNDAEIEGFRFGPHVIDLESTLHAIISVFGHTAKAAVLFFNMNESNKEVDRLTEQWKRLVP